MAGVEPAGESHARDRRAPARARRARHVRCWRVRSPHVSLRPVGLREDLFAGSRAGASTRRDRPPSDHPRSELRLRQAGRAARGSRRASSPRAMQTPRQASSSGAQATAFTSQSASSTRARERLRWRSIRWPIGRSSRSCDELLGEGTTIEELATSEAPHAHALRLRAENLGVPGWQLWARGRPGRSSTMSSAATHAVSSSISAPWRPARSKPSPRRPCSRRSGAGAPIASPSCRDRRGAQRLPGRSRTIPSPRS